MGGKPCQPFHVHCDCLFAAMTSTTKLAAPAADLNVLQNLEGLPDLRLKLPPAARPSPWQWLLALDEIHEDKPLAYQQALANVYASLAQRGHGRLVYLVDGATEGVHLYFGLMDSRDPFGAVLDLQAVLEGQLPGVSFRRIEDGTALLSTPLEHTAAVLGVPSVPQPGESQENAGTVFYQGLDRIVSSMYTMCTPDRKASNASRWQIWIVAEPVAQADTQALLDSLLADASHLAALQRTQVQTGFNVGHQHSFSASSSHTEGTSASHSTSRSKTESGGTSTSSSSSSKSQSVSNTQGHTTTSSDSRSDTHGDSASVSHSSGNSLSISQELTNKRAQIWLEHVEKTLVPRLKKGLARGLFNTAIYLRAEHKATFERLRHVVIATWQGAQPTLTFLRCHVLPPGSAFAPVLPQLGEAVNPQQLRLHSLLPHAAAGQGVWLNVEELALLAGLPQRELPGVRRRKTVDFAVDLPSPSAEDALVLGAVKDHGRVLGFARAALNRRELNKHLFITGVTGAGKTTTCMRLLLEAGMPFLVIEPAKTEYRELLHHLPAGEDIEIYRPGDDPLHSFRLNPLALVRRGQPIKSHASFIRNALAAVFPMEASMPMMVEAAILEAYRERGWDVESDTFEAGDPFDPLSQAWPTFSDMVRALDRLLPTYKLGREFEEKYRGSLVSRLRSLVEGVLGDVLDVPQSLDIQAMLERRVIIELEALPGGEEKALVMAFLLGAINQAVRVKHQRDPHFRHLTLVEEAHRLLSRPEPGDRAAAMAVEAFADMLAEVRKYGEGLIIADQIPAKLIPDVIKNTHVKIVHRLFAEDDRRTMGETMMMSEAQRAFLPNLGVGEAIVFCGGWHAPAHVQIEPRGVQTDRQMAAEDQLQALAQQQLWRHGARYYANLKQHAPWLAQADAWAQFIQEGEQFWRYLIRYVQLADSDNTHGCARVHAALQGIVEKVQAKAPSQFALAQALAALLIDRGVRYKRDHLHPPPAPVPGALRFLTEALQHVLDHVTEPPPAFANAVADHLPASWDDLRGQMQSWF